MSNENQKFACIEDEDTGLYRIRALRTIGNENLGWIVNEGEDGGLISNESVLNMTDESWIDYNSKVVNCVISGDVHISGSANITNGAITSGVRISGSPVISNSTISGAVQIMGNSKISNSNIKGDVIIIADNAEIKKSSIIGNYITLNKNVSMTLQNITTSNITLDEKVESNIKMILRIRYGMPTNNRYTVYKLVKSTLTDGEYVSIYDDNYVYNVNKSPILRDLQYDYTQERICARGIHCSFTKDFSKFGIEEKADRMLTCLVDVDDIINIDFRRNGDPKLRAKKIRVRKVERYPLDDSNDMPHLILTHGLNTTYLLPIVYNNKSYEMFRKFYITPLDTNSARVSLDIDEDVDSVDNYNFTVLAPNEFGVKNIYDPSKFSTTITGDGITSTFYVEHNLNSRNLIPTIFIGEGDGPTEYTDSSIRKNVTNDCTIVFDELDRVVIGFKEAPSNNQIYTVLLVKPALPVSISQVGVNSERGLLNLSNKMTYILFQGSDVDESDFRITLQHNRSTYNIFGCVYDITDNVYHLYDFDLERSNQDEVTLTLNFQFFKNHMYSFIYGWIY